MLLPLGNSLHRGHRGGPKSVNNFPIFLTDLSPSASFDELCSTQAYQVNLTFKS
jgi:hypothetical protein